MNTIVGIRSIILTFAAFAVAVQAGPIVPAYSDPTGVGNQNFTGVLGMDFTVNGSTGIDIYSVGAFDSGQNGLTNPVTISFFDLSAIGSPVFTTVIPAGTGGTLLGGDRFYTLLSPLFLGPGKYSIVAQGFSSSDLNGNSGAIPGANYPTMNTNGGLISFTGTSRWGYTGFPTNIDVSVAQYGAGTFTFGAAAATDTAATPEPGTTALMGGGLMLLGLVSRRFRKQ